MAEGERVTPFQQRFQDLMREGYLVSEARYWALLETRHQRSHGYWCPCRVCREAVARRPE